MEILAQPDAQLKRLCTTAQQQWLESGVLIMFVGVSQTPDTRSMHLLVAYLPGSCGGKHLIECIDYVCKPIFLAARRLRREIPSVSGAEQVEMDGLAETGGGEGAPAGPVVAFAISVTSLDLPKAAT